MVRIDSQRPLLSHKYSLPASMQKMEAFENLPVLEVAEGFKVKDNGPATKAAKQTNPLREAAYT